MVKYGRWFLVVFLLLAMPRLGRADARFDLTGPKVDVRVTRNGQTLDIAQVPNLQPGDRLWLHPDLPATQSVKYLLICAFLRGTTNPPPDNWFTRIETWDKKVREEGTFVTVPKDAQQAVLFLAPETGGDFSTLRSAVKGRPGVFVRAQQDLIEAGFEQARIEKYLASIRRVPVSDSENLQKHSDLLARTLALKPNSDCFKQPVDTQFTCLTQTGNQTLLDDSHAQSLVSSLSNGPSSDFINAASYTGVAGAGMYSAYVGAIVDLVRIMGNLHTAKYQYIPAIAFPQGSALNLRLNTPPSFENPKSVIVIGLPAVQKAVPPPLRPADANQVTCLIQPSVALPIEGAPLVFSTSFAHDLVLHLNTPPGAPEEDDIPLVADAYQGGLVLQHGPQHHRPLRENLEADLAADRKAHKPPKLGQDGAPPSAGAPAPDPAPKPPAKPQPEPVLLTGTVKGMWGFDSFTGPTVTLQQLPGEDWHIVGNDGTNLIAGHTATIVLASTGTACVHSITAQPSGDHEKLDLKFKPKPQQEAQPLTPPDLVVTVPLEHATRPGDLHVEIQQYGQPRADELATRTFSEPAHIAAIDLHAGDKSLVVTGSGLTTIAKLTLGDLVFKPQPTSEGADTSLRMALPDDASAPPTHANDHLTADITLNDGRTLHEPLTVAAARPSITLLRKTMDPPSIPGITLSNPAELPLSSRITFTLKSQSRFPRNGEIEIETLDGTLRAVLTLAPAGGLLLQDPHTVVATLDPLRSFGPSAFGALHMRALFPPRTEKSHHESEQATETTPSSLNEDTIPSSDWIPLAILVRLPVLSSIACPADPTASCTLSGTNLFLLQAISTDPAFANPVSVPDGFTGSTLAVPHPASAGTLFVKLRDDPGSVDTATVQTTTPPSTTASTTHLHAHPSKPSAAHSVPDDSPSTTTSDTAPAVQPAESANQ